MTELATHATDYGVVEREPPEVMARNLRIALASLVERDGVLLRRVPLRVLLSPLARLARRSGGRSTSTRR